MGTCACGGGELCHGDRIKHLAGAEEDRSEGQEVCEVMYEPQNGLALVQQGWLLVSGMNCHERQDDFTGDGRPPDLDSQTRGCRGAGKLVSFGEETMLLLFFF